MTTSRGHSHPSVIKYNTKEIIKIKLAIGERKNLSVNLCFFSFVCFCSNRFNFILFTLNSSSEKESSFFFFFNRLSKVFEYSSSSHLFIYFFTPPSSTPTTIEKFI